MPCSTSAAVTGPVPGPSSITGPSAFGSTCRAMVRASTLLDGITAPVRNGFSIHERMNCTSSSRSGFFATRMEDCKGMLLPVTRGSARRVSVTRIERRAPGQDGYSVWLPRVASVSKKSFTLPKKPEDSGCVSAEESFSNSASSSRCLLLRFCGVSTET